MLPCNNLIKNNENTAKFADTAILQLVEDMIALGAIKGKIKSQACGGGAQMFSFNGRDSQLLKIGGRNVIS